MSRTRICVTDRAFNILWSRTRTSAEKLAQQLNQPDLLVYDNWQELIEEAPVDVIGIATPPTLRREPVMMAYEKGLHLLIENPFSVSLAGARDGPDRTVGEHSIGYELRQTLSSVLPIRLVRYTGRSNRADWCDSGGWAPLPRDYHCG